MSRRRKAHHRLPSPRRGRGPRSNRPTLRFIAAWVLVGIAAQPAEASDASYGRYPLGGRAVGLGGAFTALASDPSGLFYNPAGLVDVSRGAVQVGTNLYGIEVEGGLGQAFARAVRLDRVVGQLEIIPTTATGVNVLAKDLYGRPTTAFSVGSFVPAWRNRLQTSVEDLPPEDRFPGCGRIAYERTLRDQRFLFGAGVGHRVNDRWSVGASAFVAYRTLLDREEIACTDTEMSDAGFSTSDSRISLSVFALQLNFGAKLRLANGWRFGAVLMSPSVRLFGQAGIRVRQTRARGNEQAPELVLRDLTDVTADTRNGLALRIGSAYEWRNQATVAFDATIYAPVRYELLKLDDENESILQASTLINDIDRRFVVNVATGGEYLFTKSFSLAGGLFTNLSSAPGLPGPTGTSYDQNRLPQIHEVGATLVAGFFSKHNLTRAGLLLTYGNGSIASPAVAGLEAVGGDTRFTKVDVQRAAIYFFLSTTVRYGPK